MTLAVSICLACHCCLSSNNSLIILASFCLFSSYSLLSPSISLILLSYSLMTILSASSSPPFATTTFGLIVFSTCLALYPNLNELMLCSIYCCTGVKHTIMHVLEFPLSDVFSNLVSGEFL